MNDNVQASESNVSGVFGRAAAKFGSMGNFAYFGDRLALHAQVAEGHRVLDVATGRGAVAFSAAKRVGAKGSVVGVDIAPEMLKETQKELASGLWPMIELHQMEAENLRFFDSAFDRVLCGFALWFFPNPERGLQEFHRVLRPGGRAALSVIARDSPWNNLVRRALLAHGRETPEGSALPRFDTIERLEAVLRTAGFTDLKIVADDFHTVITKGADAIWEVLWSGGYRRIIEKMTEDELRAARSNFLDELKKVTQSDGIHLVFRALLAVGTKPAR